MPHLTFQYTGNIDEEIDFKEMFKACHEILAHTGGIKIENCKSRAIKLDNYYIARGEPDHAFIHLDVRFLEGRPVELKKKIGKQLLDLLEKIYAPAVARFNLQVTVEVRDIAREFYFKFPAGSFTSNFT